VLWIDAARVDFSVVCAASAGTKRGAAVAAEGGFDACCWGSGAATMLSFLCSDLRTDTGFVAVDAGSEPVSDWGGIISGSSGIGKGETALVELVVWEGGDSGWFKGGDWGAVDGGT
jgi:hypothetical protein